MLAYLLNEALEMLDRLTRSKVESELLGIHGLDPESESFFFVHK